MPIPRSEEYVPGNQPDTFVQATRGPSVGKAIADFGVQITGQLQALEAEKQASVDRTAKMEFTKQKRLADLEYESSVSAAKNESEIDAAAQKRSSSIDGFFDEKNLSDDVREELVMESDFIRDQTEILSQSSKARLAERNERTLTVSESEKLAMNGDLSTAKTFIKGSPVLNDAEKIIEVGRLQADYDRVTKERLNEEIVGMTHSEQAEDLGAAIDETEMSPYLKSQMKSRVSRASKTLQNFEQTAIRERYETAIQSAESVDQLDAIVNDYGKQGQVDQVTKERLSQTIKAKANNIRKTQASIVTDSIRDAKKTLELIDKGQIVSEFQVTDAIQDEDLRSAMIDIFNSKGGSVGVESSEFIDLNEELEEWSGKWTDLNKKTKDKINTFLSDPKYSTEAKLEIAQSAMLQHAIDVKDGDLNKYLDNVDGKMTWVDEEIELDNSQRLLVQTASEQFANMVKPAIEGRGASWTKSPISAMDAKRLLNLFHSKAVYDDFENLDDSQFQEKYKQVIQPVIDKMVSRSAINRYRKIVLEKSQND